jgi:hypothetical protein
MTMFVSEDSVQNGDLPPTDVTYINPSQIAFILCEGVNLIFVTTQGFNLYATYADAPTCQSTAAALVASIG